jgi:hypothetical protein
LQRAQSAPTVRHELAARGKGSKSSSAGETSYLPQLQATRRSVQLADLAHRSGIPLDELKDCSELFKRHARIPSEVQSVDILSDGALDREAMEAVVCELTPVCRLSELPQKIASKVLGDAGLRGSVCFEDFAAWHEQRAFLPAFNLSEQQRRARKLGNTLGLEPADLNNYADQFDKFDLNKNGIIEFNEFRELLYSLMKVPKTAEIPEARVKNFFQICDTGRTGYVDFEEFVNFCSRYLGDNPAESSFIYQGVRQSSKCSASFIDH